MVGQASRRHPPLGCFIAKLNPLALIDLYRWLFIHSLGCRLIAFRFGFAAVKAAKVR